MDLDTIFFISQLIALLVWPILAFALWRKGHMRSAYGGLCAVAVICLVGYLFAIFAGVLGSGFNRGLVFPNFDAFISPFEVFYFGIPALMLLITAAYILHLFKTRRLNGLGLAYLATSLYVLLGVWLFHIAVIASV